jgi:hypothetical protein
MQVLVRNPEFGKDSWRFHQPEFFEYSGEEVKMRHVSADELALTTGIAEFPIRVLQRKYIVSVDGRAVSEPASKNPTRIVPGSRGEEYVIVNGSCTCAGFQFRRTCKHVKEV